MALSTLTANIVSFTRRDERAQLSLRRAGTGRVTTKRPFRIPIPTLQRAAEPLPALPAPSSAEEPLAPTGRTPGRRVSFAPPADAGPSTPMGAPSPAGGSEPDSMEAKYPKMNTFEEMNAFRRSTKIKRTPMPGARDDDENAPDHSEVEVAAPPAFGDDASPAAAAEGEGEAEASELMPPPPPRTSSGSAGTPSGAMATLSMGTSTDATPADDSPADDRPLAERVSFGTQMTPVEPPPPLLMPPKERVSAGTQMTPVDGAADAAASTSDPLAGARDWSVGADDDDGDHPPAFDSPGGYSGCGDDEPTALPDAPSELMPPPPPPLDAADGPAAKKARKGAAPGERRKRKNSMEKLGPQPPPSQPGAPGGPMTAEQLAQIAADGGAYHVSKRGRRVFKPFAFWVAGEGIENGRRASGKFAAPVAFRRNGVRYGV